MKKYPNYRTSLAIFAIAMLSWLSLPTTADALTISPTRFEVKGNPGDVVSEEIILINETNNIETYYSSFSNFEAQGESGSPAFVDPKEGLGTWMKTDESATLSPGQQKIIPFKITIPTNAEPGGHFAVLFWGTSPAGQGVSIGAKTGILVLLSVNGDVKEAGGLLNFNTKDNKFFYNTLPVSFEYRFKNDGGDRIKPQGKISILDTLFLPSDKINANPSEGNVLPLSTRKYNVDWVEYERPMDYVAPTNFAKKFWSDVSYQWKNFAVGLYSAHLNLTYGTQALQVKKTAWFFVFPWQLVLVMILLFIIVFWGGKKLIKRYNRFIIEKAKVGMNTHAPSMPSHDSSL
ncbi:MAG: hypothetical protein KBC06_01475 [Candidatus Pacebacteria bacterium]|nr:hypothetical protein [Candidatus Paceibacterota bacterium]